MYSLVWQLNSSGLYSSQSLYKVVDFRGIKPVFASAIWSLKIPPRVQCFLWLLTKNKVLTRDNLSKRRKVEDSSCLFCCELESVSHLFFDCAVAKQMWFALAAVFNIHLEPSLDSIGKFWLSNRKNCVLNIISSFALWSLTSLSENRVAEYGYALA